jgi:hypothetical protein
VGEVDASELVEGEAEVEVRGIAFGLTALAFGRLEGFVGRVNFGFEGGVEGLELGVAVFDLLLEEVVGLEGLSESEEVLGEVVAFQGLGDLVLGVMAARVAVLGEFEGVMLAIGDVADDGQAGSAGDVRDDIGELEVHLLEGLVEVVDFAGGGLDERVTVTDEVPEGADVLRGAEGGAQ